MQDPPNRKQTTAVPDSSILAEVVKVSCKLDEMKRDFGNELLSQRDQIRHISSRVETLELARKSEGDMARKALKSSSDLAEHVQQTEEAMKTAFSKASDRIGAVERKVDDMSAEQTPLLREIRDEQIRRLAREKALAEQTRKAVEEKREAERQAKAKHERRKTGWGIAIAILGIIVPAIASYLGTRQANSDSPPHAVQVDGHEKR